MGKVADWPGAQAPLRQAAGRLVQPNQRTAEPVRARGLQRSRARKQPAQSMREGLAGQASPRPLLEPAGGPAPEVPPGNPARFWTASTQTQQRTQ